LNYDPARISWSDGLITPAEKGKQHQFESGQMVESIYRPFFRQHLYYARSLHERVYQMPKLFPEPFLKILVICATGLGERREFAVFMAEHIPDLHLFADATLSRRAGRK
jgi:predicted helicase